MVRKKTKITLTMMMVMMMMTTTTTDDDDDGDDDMMVTTTGVAMPCAPLGRSLSRRLCGTLEMRTLETVSSTSDGVELL